MADMKKVYNYLIIINLYSRALTLFLLALGGISPYMSITAGRNRVKHHNFCTKIGTSGHSVLFTKKTS